MSSVSRLFTIIFCLLFVESIGIGLYFDTLTGFDKTIVGKVGCNIGLVQASSGLRMQVYGPNGACASGNTAYTAVSSIATGQWIYAAGTYEVGVGVKLYMNSVLASTVAYTGNIGNYPDVLFFGGSINASYAMNGRIGEAKVYSKALTQAEVTQNFNAARTRFGI